MSKSPLKALPRPASTPAVEARGDALTRFVGHALLMLDPCTPEPRRRQLEPAMLALLPVLRAMGVFELFDIRHPGLRALIADELKTPT